MNKPNAAPARHLSIDALERGIVAHVTLASTRARTSCS
jgi:hypothetical protein